jgi:hypothetical protein
MRAWVNFYGGKWALARRYGPPQREHVVEAFAGFAGYSTYWEPARVTLIEKDRAIIGVWRFLQRVSRQEIMAIPTAVESVDELQVLSGSKMAGGVVVRPWLGPAREAARPLGMALPQNCAR